MAEKIRLFPRDLARLILYLCLAGVAAGCATTGGPGSGLAAGDGKQWFKGNTHTHTLWSDGDAAPELAVAWYKEHGYDFLSITDHNAMLQGERLFPIKEDSRLTDERVAQLQEKFGEDNVELRSGRRGRPTMRLKTLDELRELFEEPEKFLLIEGEEVTGVTHVNGINVRKLIKQSRAKDSITSLREQIGSIHDQRDELGLPMFAHIDHPNWGPGITAEDIIAVPEGRFFEVYNGHGGVRNWGDEKLRIPDTDRKWDIILAHRISADPDGMLYGIATDDTHTYFRTGAGHQIPGRGWAMVLADALDTDSIVRAFMRGDFYSSEGVTLDEISWDSKRFRVVPRTESGITYTTQFIGTRRGFDRSSVPAIDDDGVAMDNRTRIYGDGIGEVLFETTGVPAVYRFQGDEMYVRAKVISTKPKSQPFKEGDVEMAWTQPVVLPE